jgi:hypothetical protein
LTLPASWRSRSASVFAAASFLTIALGAVSMALDGESPALWLRNPIAWLLAAGLGVLLARRGWPGAAMAPLALVAVGLSFISPGQEGVHRWLGAGPVQLNAAALVLPLAIASFGRTPAWLAATSFALIAAALAWQPDISQLAAIAAAAIILAAFRFGWTGALAALAVAAGTIALCLTRPDPLEPVPHVEGIFLLAWSQSAALAIAMTASLAAASLSPLLLWPVAALRPAATALAAYFTFAALAVLFGAYPAPLAGYGLSFVIGWWLGIAALAVEPRKSA